MISDSNKFSCSHLPFPFLFTFSGSQPHFHFCFCSHILVFIPIIVSIFSFPFPFSFLFFIPIPILKSRSHIFPSSLTYSLPCITSSVLYSVTWQCCVWCCAGGGTQRGAHPKPQATRRETRGEQRQLVLFWGGGRSPVLLSGGKVLMETMMTHAYHVINLILIPQAVVISRRLFTMSGMLIKTGLASLTGNVVQTRVQTGIFSATVTSICQV